MADDLTLTPAEDEAQPPLTDDAPIPAKYIKVRLNPPGHFSQWKTRPLSRLPDFREDTDTAGISASTAHWAVTGAETLQLLLFDTTHGWTPEKVEAWFAARPQLKRPVADMPVTQDAAAAPVLVEATLSDVAATMEMTVSAARPFSLFAVNVLREGWGKNRRLGADGRYYQDYFPLAFLRQLAPMLDGTPVQAIHIAPKGEDSGDLPDRVADALAELRRHGHPTAVTNLLLDQGLIGNTIGFLRQPTVLDNAGQDEEGASRAAIRAQFALADTAVAEQTRQLIQFAWQQGFKQSLGLSVNYRANARFGEVDGRPAFLFEQPTHHVSTELVANPAAHGGIVAVLQSMADEKVEQVEMTESAATPPVAAQDVPDAPATQAATVAAAPNAELGELKQIVQTLAASQDKLSAQLSAIHAREARNALEVIVTQSAITDADVRKDLLAGIADGTYPTESAVKAVVRTSEKMQKLLVAAQQSAAPAPIFPGMSSLQVGAEPADYAKVRTKLYWDLPLTQAEQDLQAAQKIRGYMTLKDEYMDYTGDRELQFHGLDVERMSRMMAGFTQSTITTATYPDFLRNVLEQRVVRHWETANKDHLRVVRIGEPFETTRPEEEFIIGAMSEISEVAEDGNFTEAAAPYTEKVTSVAQKFGNILAFSEEMILNNRGNEIKQITDEFVAALNRTLARQIYDMVYNYGTAFNNKDVGTSASGGVLYASSLGNYVDGNSYDIDKMRLLVDAMLTATNIAPEGETGAEMPLDPYLAICNKKHAGLVAGILNGQYEITSSNIANSLSLNFPAERVIGVHQNFMRSKPTAVILLPNPAECAFAELRYHRGRTAPELVFEGNQQPQFGYAFSSDRMLLKLKMRWRLTLMRKKAPFALYPSA